MELPAAIERELRTVEDYIVEEYGQRPEVHPYRLTALRLAIERTLFDTELYRAAQLILDELDKEQDNEPSID